jgi:hypothetical protein
MQAMIARHECIAQRMRELPDGIERVPHQKLVEI